MTAKARHWWQCCTPRQKAVICRIGPLVAFAFVVALDWLRLNRQGVATSGDARRLFLVCGVAILVSVALKLLFTRRWAPQELGHVGLLLGLAALLVRLLGRYGDQPVPEWERDIYQSLLDVGALVLLVSMLVWVWFRMRRERETEHPEAEAKIPEPALTGDDVIRYDGPNRRAELPGRRASDRR